MIEPNRNGGFKRHESLITYQYEADSMDRQWYSIL